MTFIIFVCSFQILFLMGFQVVPIQNIKTNTPAGDSGKGILYGVYQV